MAEVTVDTLMIDGCVMERDSEHEDRERIKNKKKQEKAKNNVGSFD